MEENKLTMSYIIDRKAESEKRHFYEKCFAAATPLIIFTIISIVVLIVGYMFGG